MWWDFKSAYTCMHTRVKETHLIMVCRDGRRKRGGALFINYFKMIYSVCIMALLLLPLIIMVGMVKGSDDI